MAVLAVPTYWQPLDSNGEPRPGGLVYTYAAGTTTPKASFTDAGGLTQTTNPIVLDASGRATVWIDGAYKFVVTNADGTDPKTTDHVNSFVTTGDEADPYFESFSGNGSQTVFTTSQDLGTDERAVYIFIAGVYQQPTTYTVNGTSLTFAVAPASASNNISVTLPSSFVGAAAASAAQADLFATAAENSAIAGAASEASAAADAVATAADAVSTAADVVSSAANAALAQNYAESYSGTSTTSLAIGTGAKVFTTQSGKLWVEGQFLQIASDASAVNYMHGTVTSYSGTTLTMNITNIGGSGTLADWNISISGSQGNTGPTGPAGGPLVDGDYGDVTVSGTGSVITINPEAVTVTKIGSGAATVGQVLTADGAGGAAFDDVSSAVGFTNNGYKTNLYYTPAGHDTEATATGTMTANRLYAVPILILADTTFTRIGIEVTTLSAGNARLGIYNVVDGEPTSLLADLGTVSTSSTGEKEVTISQLLPAGIYMLGAVFSATPVVRNIFTVDAALTEGMLLGGGAASGTSGKVGYYVAHTYGALPSSFGATTQQNQSNCPLIWLRKV